MGIYAGCTVIRVMRETNGKILKVGARLPRLSRLGSSFLDATNQEGRMWESEFQRDNFHRYSYVWLPDDRHGWNDPRRTRRQ